MAAEAGPVLAIDCGGTRLKCGLVAQGQVQASRILPASADSLADSLRAAATQLDDLLAKADLQATDCRGLALGIPALVDHAAAKVHDSYGKYPDAPSLDLRAWADGRFALPLAVENDARLALLGEWRFGAGRGCRDCVLVTLGTGIGTAVLLENRPLRGRSGSAGNLGGHGLARFDGWPCSCGRRGCYESESGSASLPARARDLQNFTDSPLASEASVDYQAVFHHAAAGDACAVTLRDAALALWGELLIDLARQFAPERLLLAGGLLQSATIILPALQEAVAQGAGLPGRPPQVLAAEHPDHAALLGAAVLLAESCHGL